MSSNDAEYVVRSATSHDEVQGLWWRQMRDLGWNRHDLDGASHYKVGRDGKDWLVVVPKGSETPVGMVIGFTYPNQTGWVGFFILNAEFRGKGWGGALFKAALDSFEQSNLQYIGLDGVEEQVPTYGRRGFVATGRINLFSRDSLQSSPLATSSTPSLEGNDLEVVDIRDVDTKALADLDLAHTGLDRGILWTKAMFDRPDAYGYAIISTASKELRGFVLVRECEHGHRVGPLLADNSNQAAVLLERAMSQLSASAGNWIAEVFGPNENSAKPFIELGWKYLDIDYHRMWVGGKQPPQQAEGGRGTKGMFAIFDASEG